MQNCVHKIKTYALNLTRRVIERRSRHEIKKNAGLWEVLQSYISKSGSTGCSYSDYWSLYCYLRRTKPEEILECGTGVSTVLMAYTLIENEREGVKGYITSMESDDKYYEMARNLLPGGMVPYVEIINSPVVEDVYSLFRGVRYENIPMKKEYDFVYVDGPSYVAPSDNTLAFDFDYLHILKNAEKPVSAVIDKRVSTCYVLQKLLGTQKVTYNAIKHLGFVAPCRKSDIMHFDETTPSAAFDKSFKVIGNTELSLKLTK